MQSAFKQWQNVPLRRDARFDTYFHTLSHDLRTPLNHISGFAELLNLGDDLPLAQKEYAIAIVSACGELKNVVLAHLQLIENSLASQAQAGAVSPGHLPAPVRWPAWLQGPPSRNSSSERMPADHVRLAAGPACPAAGSLANTSSWLLQRMADC